MSRSRAAAPDDGVGNRGRGESQVWDQPLALHFPEITGRNTDVCNSNCPRWRWRRFSVGAGRMATRPFRRTVGHAWPVLADQRYAVLQRSLR